MNRYHTVNLLLAAYGDVPEAFWSSLKEAGTINAF